MNKKYNSKSKLNRRKLVLSIILVSVPLFLIFGYSNFANCFSKMDRRPVSIAKNEKLEKLRALAKKSLEEQEKLKSVAQSVTEEKKDDEKNQEIVKQTPNKSDNETNTTTKNNSNNNTTSQASPVDNLKAAQYASKIITVIGQGGSNATITLYEKINGVWTKSISSNGFVGKYGITYSPSESRAATPAGIFTLSLGFGIASNPGMQIPYKKITANDYWVDDPNSKYYNMWMEGPADGRWSSAEHLIEETVSYKYGAVIDYNTDRIPGKGSAIFFHVSNGSPTAGCVAIPEGNLINILKKLDNNTRMIIVPQEKDLKNY